ncbi:unnamed protein product, partial [Closterium sp. NIES-54]
MRWQATQATLHSPPTAAALPPPLPVAAAVRVLAPVLAAPGGAALREPCSPRCTPLSAPPHPAPPSPHALPPSPPRAHPP